VSAGPIRVPYVRTIVEIPPKRDTVATVPPGHAYWHQECTACHRDYRVYVPADPPFVGGLTLDIPCPHCHRHKAEVLISLVSGPILVEAVERTWLEWRRRRAGQVLHVIRRIVAVRAGQFVRAISRLGRSGPAEQGAEAPAGGRRLALAVAGLLALAAIHTACWQGIVLRRIRIGSDHPYRTELCSPAPTPQAAPREFSDPAPGSYYVPSPSGRYLALSREAASSYHTIHVWDEHEHRLRAVVSVQESDPGSGSAHDYRWSRDSRALLISGSGALPFHKLEDRLAYVYVVDEDALYKVPACS
jgi:hypothetical protein